MAQRAASTRQHEGVIISPTFARRISQGRRKGFRVYLAHSDLVRMDAISACGPGAKLESPIAAACGSRSSRLLAYNPRGVGTGTGITVSAYSGSGPGFRFRGGVAGSH